jgi:bifunctional non-homologous end joining protein LigD
MTSSETWSLDDQSINVTDLEKVYWPKEGLTKGDVLAYYRELAPVILPYLKDRPVTIKVFPKGIEGESFYRRDVAAKKPAWLNTTSYRPASSAKTSRLLLVDDAASLIWLANRGAIEFHFWLSRTSNLNEPDLAVFDLDPGDQAGFRDVLTAALRLRDLLAKKDLTGYPKTSGGKGLHVILPLGPRHVFEGVRTWVKGIAESLADEYPDLIAVAHGGTHRGTHVTIDHAQNAIARNLAAPYTLRGSPSALVSAPISWGEIEDGKVNPEMINLNTVQERLQKVGDLFAPLNQQRYSLPKSSA